MIRIQIELIRGEGKLLDDKIVNITVNNKPVDVTIVNSQ